MSRFTQALWVLAAFSGVFGRQAPLRSVKESIEWDLNSPPKENSTAHLLFDTINSLLQHWPNTRYRNDSICICPGHTVVPGTIPLGTLLYHGTYSPEVPAVPEWLATDPEHSYLFCWGTREKGCWHHTYVATRPLKVLYFDGSSAAKMLGGTMDAQDIMAWGTTKPEWMYQERKRIGDLCAWGKPFGLDGFVRMEMDFEVMYCDFKNGLQPVLKLELVNPIIDGRLPPPKASGDLKLPITVLDDTGRINTAVVTAGSWHNHYPGEPRIKLDLSRLVSFYDTELVPSLIPSRFNKTRFTHRLEGISSDDVKAVMVTIEDALASQIQGSGIDWNGLFRVITLRYADHLEILHHHLNSTETNMKLRTPLESADLILQELRIMLTPYILHNVVPPASGNPSDNSWASPIFRLCATTHIDFITTMPPLMTSSERLLLSAIRGTNREICRVIVKVWAEAVAEGLDPASQPPNTTPTTADVDEDKLNTILDGWRADIKGLMDWLDWNIWIKCKPACGFEEMCYLPTWPYFRQPRNHDHQVVPTPIDDDEIYPQPRCLRRVAPYEVNMSWLHPPVSNKS